MKKRFIKIVSFPKVVIGNLQKLFVIKKPTAKNSERSPIATLGDDSLIYQKGFTLIELLVVVLIIGILAAVALPKYQVAVRKSRIVQLMTLAEAVAKAEEVYHMANGAYTENLSALDITLPGTAYSEHNIRGKDWGCTVAGDVSGDHVYCGYNCRKGANDPLCGNSYSVWFTYSRHPNDRYCSAYDDIGDKACLSMGAKFSSSTEYDRSYIF